MNEENFTSEFNLKFETIEETFKYIADSQLKREWLLKQEKIESRKRMDEIEKTLARVANNLDLVNKDLQHVSKHLTHITRVLGFNIEEYQFQEDKLQKAGNILQEKRPQ